MRGKREDLGTRQEQFHLHFLHSAISEKGPHIQVLQPVGHLGQMVGGNWGGGETQSREEICFNALIYPCLSPS